MWILVAAMAWGADRDPLPARWVERPLVLPRGWMRAELWIAQHPAEIAAPLALGDAPRRDEGGIELGLGVLPRVEIWIRLPAVRGRLADRDRLGLGDPQIGVRASLLRREPPNRSVALAVSATSPHGADREGIVLSTGLTRLSADLAGRAQLAGWGIDGALGPRLILPGPTSWSTADVVDAGDGGQAHLAVFLQAGPVVPEVSITASARGVDRIDGIPTAPASAAVAVSGGARIQLSRGLWIAGTLTWPVLRGDLLPGDLDPQGSTLQIGAAL